MAAPPAPPEGLPLADLLAGPLLAVHMARVEAAEAALDVLLNVGFEPAPGEAIKPDIANFTYNTPDGLSPDGVGLSKTVKLSVPLLAVTELSSQTVRDVSIDFGVEITALMLPDAAAAPWCLHGLAHGPGTTPPPENAAPRIHIALKAEDVGISEGVGQVIEGLAASLTQKAPVRKD